MSKLYWQDKQIRKQSYICWKCACDYGGGCDSLLAQADRV